MHTLTMSFRQQDICLERFSLACAILERSFTAEKMESKRAEAKLLLSQEPSNNHAVGVLSHPLST